MAIVKIGSNEQSLIFTDELEHSLNKMEYCESYCCASVGVFWQDLSYKVLAETSLLVIIIKKRSFENTLRLSFSPGNPGHTLGQFQF